MEEEIGNRLRPTLRSLCYQTKWNYATFWKLERSSSMMLTWEDAYYDQSEASNSSKKPLLNFSNDIPCNLYGDGHVGDELGLALAKMSYLVHCLGEGIIGQVAFTGKHQWIFADRSTAISSSSTDILDGWHTQFSVGIKTVAIIAVVPYGVVQLGSFNLIPEDFNQVCCIRSAFGLLQSQSAAFSDSKPSDLLPQFGNILNELEVSHDYQHGFDQESLNRGQILPPHILPSPGNYSNLYSDNHQPLVFCCEAFELRCPEEGALGFASGKSTSDNEKRVQLEQFYNPNVNLDSVGEQDDAWKLDSSCLPAVFESSDRGATKFDTHSGHQVEGIHLSEPLEMKRGNESGNMLSFKSNGNWTDAVKPPLQYSAGCELYEALGSRLKEQDTCIWEDKISAKTEELDEATNVMLDSLCSGSEGLELLEAVVASVCPDTSNMIGENSSWESDQSLLTAESITQHLEHVKHRNSASDRVQPCMMAKGDSYQQICSRGGSHELVSMASPNVISSKALDSCSELPDVCVEPANMSKKRAKRGENCRPRPRDRQLIQDRIKELRDIVPNGSKCSIDALLERTIKHMLFLKSVTTYADRLKICTESKLCDKVSRLLRTCSHDHGVSWALELGIRSNTCPITVENLNANGQMLIEMMCEECSLFFKIADAIRGLGFAILKGVTEYRAEKTWACFVVEGQGNGSSQRMDILWSLMQLSQPKQVGTVDQLFSSPSKSGNQ